MALSASVQWSVMFGGNDGNNGGSFDPSVVATGGFTDGAATLATGTSCAFTSASYSFVAGDTNAWLFIASGTNWNPGWYQIVLVSGGTAFIRGNAGQWVSYVASPQSVTLSTVQGCGTVASPTGATWSIDYSQQNAAQFTYTDLTDSGTGVTMTSAANPFGKQQVGNTVQINNTGTGGFFIVGFYTLKSVSGTTGTFDRNVSAGVGVNGGGGMGGAFATLNQTLVTMIGSNRCWVQFNASAIPMAAAPTVNPASITPTNAVTYTRISGYNTYRGDNPQGAGRPTIQSTGSATTMIPITTNGWMVENLIFDCNSVTTSSGVTCSGQQAMFRYLLIKNFKVNGISVTGNNAQFRCVEVTGGITGATAALNAGGISNEVLNCYVHDNVCPGVLIANSGGSAMHCVAYNNTGASSDGFACSSFATIIENCVAYGNGRDGIRMSSTQANNSASIHNNILVSNTGYGLNFTQSAFQSDDGYNGNAYYNNTSGVRNQCGRPAGDTLDIILTGNPFVSVGTNFALNNTAGAGAACRAAGLPANPPGLAGTTSYLDMGAVQHQDSPANISINVSNTTVLSGNSVVGY